MRILVVTNYYPPHYIGGYEIGCQEAVEGLRKHGHQVEVLTSNYCSKAQKEVEETGVYRWLKLQITKRTRGLEIFFELYLIEFFNHSALSLIINKFKPDIVYVWNMDGLPVSLLFRVQKLKISLFYFVFDFWLSHWEQDRWHSILDFPMPGLKGKLRALVAYPLLRITGFHRDNSSLSLGENVQFASQYLKKISIECGQHVEKSRVISWGLDTSNYPCKEASNSLDKILYVGQVIKHKGVHTVIEALGILSSKECYSSVSLTIAGGFGNFEYEVFLRKLVASLKLNNRVSFLGFIARKELVSIYHDHDILVFPSIWEEPFGITLLEGMASGLPVVSTANGGSKDILRDEFNSLIFPKEDHHRCADQIARLIDNPSLAKEIRRNARYWVEKEFALVKTLQGIEKHLTEKFSIVSP